LSPDSPSIIVDDFFLFYRLGLPACTRWEGTGVSFGLSPKTKSTWVWYAF